MTGCGWQTAGGLLSPWPGPAPGVADIGAVILRRLASLIARANTATGTIAFTTTRLSDGLADKAIRRIATKEARKVSKTKDIRDAVEAELIIG
jgi:hypothetical protein